MTMKRIIYFLLILFPISMNAQNKPEKFQALPFGSVKPTGWIRIQMQSDIEGFVGNLDKLVPDLMNDPIYSTGRLQQNSKAKDLGNHKEGDAAGDEQYKWWNSETQSNWWDGYIRNVFLLDDKKGIEKVNQYIQNILATQDEDGYIGIYSPELRYNFTAENGELWAKATLYRGLLAYYEATNDQKVWNALIKAVDNVMQNYPVNNSSPFYSGNNFNGGVSHGLTFTDVLDKMYQFTGDEKFQEYALFLYNDFSETYQSECDVQLTNILDSAYKLKSHGVHTYEHLRPLIVAAFASDEPLLDDALNVYLDRIAKTTSPSGGAIGDEWIAGRNADATHTGYEYCSLHELLDSYTMLLQKSGKAPVADVVENIFYNAAQGSRNPDHSCIAYLKTDNSYEMMGTKNGEIEPDRKQTRYKYSPAHQDVAVCCSPNAGRITPYFIQSSWMKQADTLVATLLMPNILNTEISNNNIQIENVTGYPYQNSFIFKIKMDKPATIKIKIRKPGWVEEIITDETYMLEDDFLIIERKFRKKDNITLEFKTSVKIHHDINHEKYFTYGALVFAHPIPSKQSTTKEYLKGFDDLSYEPLDKTRYLFSEKNDAVYRNGRIEAGFINAATNTSEILILEPIGKTILRQTTFR